MKTIYTLCAVALLFTSCKKCYECRVMVKTTNSYGNLQSEPPVIINKCGMTARQARLFMEQNSYQTTTVINNKTVTTQSTTICN